MLYIVLWIASCEFWLFPNLFADDKGVVDSFIPVITFSVRKGDTFAMQFSRCVCLGLLIYVSYSLIKEPKIITSVSSASFKGVADILEWGQFKLEGNVTDQVPEKKVKWEDLEDDYSKSESQHDQYDDNYKYTSEETSEEDDDKI